MNVNEKKILEEIKLPILRYYVERAKLHTPDIKSYMGGIPYTEKNDHIPLCHTCKKSLEFVFQLHVPKNKKSTIFAFYYCFHCNPVEGNKGFKVLKYSKPSLDKMMNRQEWKSKIPVGQFEFNLDWSLPSWNTLALTNPDVYSLFSSQHKKNAGVIYENSKNDLLDSFENFSFFGGYPNFLSIPMIPYCEHCNEKMISWLQIDTLDDFRLFWADDGCLHIFKCKNGKEHYKILIE